MTENHDPALCSLAACELCDVFADGYTRGKAKGFFEIEIWDGSHAHTCGCESCRLVKLIIAKTKGEGL